MLDSSGATSVIDVEAPAAAVDPAEVLSYLCHAPPRIPAWVAYDERGSALFEKITALPTYYATRVEQALLARHAADIADGALNAAAGTTARGVRFVELGSGSAVKTQSLLAAFRARGPIAYLPIDVSRSALVSGVAQAQRAQPGVPVLGMCGRFEAGLAWLRGDHGRRLADSASEPTRQCAAPRGLVAETAGVRTVVTLLGLTLGNATATERAALLQNIASTLAPGDGLLITADLRKPAAVLERCYADPPGASAFAQFRLNHLCALNRIAGTDFATRRFSPSIHYEPVSGVVAGYLYSTVGHAVALPALGQTLRLRRGDVINVGYSAKFDRAELAAELAAHRLRLAREWLDDTWAYGAFLFRRE